MWCCRRPESHQSGVPFSQAVATADATRTRPSYVRSRAFFLDDICCVCSFLAGDGVRQWALGQDLAATEKKGDAGSLHVTEASRNNWKHYRELLAASTPPGSPATHCSTPRTVNDTVGCIVVNAAGASRQIWFLWEYLRRGGVLGCVIGRHCLEDARTRRRGCRLRCWMLGAQCRATQRFFSGLLGVRRRRDRDSWADRAFLCGELDEQYVFGLYERYH